MLLYIMLNQCPTVISNFVHRKEISQLNELTNSQLRMNQANFPGLILEDRMNSNSVVPHRLRLCTVNAMQKRCQIKSNTMIDPFDV